MTINKLIATGEYPQGVVLVNHTTGEAYTAGDGVGGATAAKQDTQITAEQAILAELVSKKGSSDIITITRSENIIPYVVGGAVGAASAIYETAVLGPANASYLITAANLFLAVASLPVNMTAGFNLRVFNSSPTAIADNAVVGTTLTTGDIDKMQAKITIPLLVDAGALCEAWNSGLTEEVKLSSTGTLFLILETNSAFTPTSAAVKKIHLHGVVI